MEKRNIFLARLHSFERIVYFCGSEFVAFRVCLVYKRYIKGHIALYYSFGREFSSIFDSDFHIAILNLTLDFNYGMGR